jgi:small subunit ribosomal protein S1
MTGVMAKSPDVPEESFAALFESSGGGRATRKRFRDGERVDVTVVAIGRDAVFADLGAKQEGYFDRASLCDESGKLSVDVGAKIAAVVTSANDASGQIRLSPVYVRRATGEPDAPQGGLDDELAVVIPKASSAPLLVEGARVRGKITGIERYGLFVQIHGTQGRGGRGLVPVSETATPRGSDLKRQFEVGQDVEAKILSIAEDGKIRLSFSALKQDEERASFEAYAKGEAAAEGEASAPAGAPQKRGSAKPAPRGFGTLGDLLGKKRAK